MQVKVGSRWEGDARKRFVVISVTEVDNHTWVHYRDDSGIREYSCYQESFIHRFRPIVNEG